MVRSLLLFLALCMLQGAIVAQPADDDVTIHLVEPGQTLYFISKKYALSIDEIRALNPDIGPDLIIRPGQALMVPRIEAPTAPPTTPRPAGEFHVVRSGETLYSLARIYEVSVDRLIDWNDLENPNIRVGDSLLVRPVNPEALFAAERDEAVKPSTPEVTDRVQEVGREATPPDTGTVGPADPVEPSIPAEETADAPTDAVVEGSGDTVAPRAAKGGDDPNLFRDFFELERTAGGELVQQKGISNHLVSPDGSATYLALVDGVPEGRILRVRNLMNNKVVYVKVVGGLPASDAQRNISLKISEAAARDLNVLEERFLAEWSYYSSL